MSSSIPEDVIDEIIDNVHDLDDVKSLRNLALASRTSLRRSRYHLFSSHTHLNSIEKLNSFCDFLDAHPDRRPWVRSIIIASGEKSRSLLEVAPVRLVTELPSLSEWKLVGSPYYQDSDPDRQISYNALQLIWLRHYTRAITHLHLDNILFQSYAGFAQYILAFPGLRHLHCERLKFQHRDHVTALFRARERLSNKIRLSHLTIDNREDIVVTLLLESAQHTLQEFVFVIHGYYIEEGSELYMKLPTLIASLSKLSSITLEASSMDFREGRTDDTLIRDAMVRVETLLRALASNSNSLITQITLRLPDYKISSFVDYLENHSHDLSQMCRALEPDLLRLQHLQKIELCHYIRRSLCNWTTMRFEHLFPTMHNRGLISTRCSGPLIQGHNSIVTALAVSPDGRWIASSSMDTTIILWDARCGTAVHEWPTHSTTVRTFPSDGRYLASAGHYEVAVWGMSEETDTRLVTTLEDADACVWLPDGTIRASGGKKGTVQAWAPSTNQVRVHSKLEGYSEARPLTTTFSPDGRWIAVFGFWDVKIWDATTGRLHKIIPCKSEDIGWNLNWSAFDSASRRIVIPSDDLEDCICIWDVETGDELAVLQGHTHEPSCEMIAFSHDGTRVLSTSVDDTMVRLWDLSNGNISLLLCGHQGTLFHACFSPDGKYVASASVDQTVRLWNASTGSCIRTFVEHDSWVRCVAFARDGETLVSGGDDGRVCIRRLRDVCPEECSGNI